MKVVSVFNANGDEIRVSPDMVEYYASIGWNQVVKKVAREKSQETEVEEFE